MKFILQTYKKYDLVINNKLNTIIEDNKYMLDYIYRKIII